VGNNRARAFLTKPNASLVIFIAEATFQREMYLADCSVSGNCLIRIRPKLGGFGSVWNARQTVPTPTPNCSATSRHDEPDALRRAIWSASTLTQLRSGIRPNGIRPGADSKAAVRPKSQIPETGRFLGKCLRYCQTPSTPVPSKSMELGSGVGRIYWNEYCDD
jgi:hypothetical protein